MDPEATKYQVRPRCIEFALEKAEEGPYWERLLAEKTKQHWLKVGGWWMISKLNSPPFGALWRIYTSVSLSTHGLKVYIQGGLWQVEGRG